MFKFKFKKKTLGKAAGKLFGTDKKKSSSSQSADSPRAEAADKQIVNINRQAGSGQIKYRSEI